jgi:MFS family permease
VGGWLRDAAGGLPRQFWFLWAGTLINRLGSFVLVFLSIYLTQDVHLSTSLAGIVVGAWGVGGAVGTMIGGVLADRWGRRPTMLTGQLGAAALMLALGFADGFWAMLICTVLLGMFAEGVRPAFQAMMIDVVPEKDRVRAFSLNYWAINLGFAASAVLAGIAAQADYLLLFVIDAGTTLVTAVITALFVREARAAHTAHRRSGGGPGLRAVFADRVFIGFVALNFLIVLVMMQHASTLPIAMTSDGISPATFGWVIAMNGLLIVAGQLFIPKLIAGYDRSRVVALACLVIGVGFGLTSIAGSAAFYAVTVLIWTVGEMLQTPANSALIADLSPSLLRGRYSGVNSLSWSAGGALAPIAGGFVQDHAGSATLWLICGILPILAAVGHLISGPARERRAAELRVGPLAPAGPVQPSPAATEVRLAEDVTPPGLAKD